MLLAVRQLGTRRRFAASRIQWDVPVLGFLTSLTFHPESCACATHPMGHRCIDQLACGNPAGSNSPDPVPQNVGGSLQSSFYEPDYEPFRHPTARLRHSYACRSRVRQTLPDASERFSKARRISDRAHLRTRMRVGQECRRRWGLPAQDSPRSVSTLGTNHRSRPHPPTIPACRAYDPWDHWCERFHAAFNFSRVGALHPIKVVASRPL